jgi:hypothetical protein
MLKNIPFQLFTQTEVTIKKAKLNGKYQWQLSLTCPLLVRAKENWLPAATFLI